MDDLLHNLQTGLMYTTATANTRRAVAWVGNDDWQEQGMPRGRRQRGRGPPGIVPPGSDRDGSYVRLAAHRGGHQLAVQQGSPG